ncbi:pyridoxamine 5'-phosphate oxidase [Massilia sp. W12]|uniref:pyridoxamine 5'-phosphate oxidase n=1 Tax=Massilia sp. W12 TaxID=3126507 RepID=UPI0030D38BAB
MTDALFETAPDFDQPLAVLKHCHEKIKKQIKTMQRLLEHLPRHGANLEAQQAAKAVLAYFNKSAGMHHADEEEDLMPLLRQVAQGEDAAMLSQLLPKILREHKKMEAAWSVLALQLEDIASGESAQLSANDVQAFGELYAEHMVKEETWLAPMAMRLFSAEQMAALGAAMRMRRGLHQVSQDEAIELPPSRQDIEETQARLQLAAIRTDYTRQSMDESELDADPIRQFSVWFEQARAARVAEVNAMTVCSVDAQGRPSSRILLLKGFDHQGFTFFTNYHSRKGREWEHNPHAALSFFWHELERQVRIEGTIEKVSPELSDQYFNSRPLASRLSALASNQSEPVTDRGQMEARMQEISAQYMEQEPPRPAHWGGYLLRPRRIEFWQGRASRFHDRVEYELDGNGGWRRQRLQP